MVGINITFDTKQFDAKIANIEQGLSDFKPVMSVLGDDLVEYFGEEIFEKQGDPKWKDLKTATLMSRDRRNGYYKQSGKSGKILVWTGRLKGGFQKLAEKTKLTISNNVPYFKFHQLGGGNLPARPMLSITNYVKKTVVDSFEYYLKKLTK